MGSFRPKWPFDFQPIILETTGFLGEDAKKFIHFVAKKAAKTTTDVVIVTEKQEARFIQTYSRKIVEQVSIAVAHANALIVEETLMKATNPESDATSLYRELRASRWRY